MTHFQDLYNHGCIIHYGLADTFANLLDLPDPEDADCFTEDEVVNLLRDFGWEIIK